MPASAQEDFETVLKAIVQVKAQIPEDARTARILGTEREGNGVVIDPQGLVLTIGYLILEAERVTVTAPNGEEFPAQFVGYDFDTGFGLVRVQAPWGIAPVELGASDAIQTGQPMLVVGFGGKDVVQGVRLVAQKEFAGYWEYLLEKALFTAPHFGSFAGAALLGPDAKLLGIGSLFTQVSVEGVGTIPCNLFVPIDLLKPILEDMKLTGRGRKSSRPWLGLHADESHGRVVVIRTTPGGPADKAGIKTSDIILTVKDQPVKGLADFYRQVWALGPARVSVPMRVLQDVQVREVTIQSADRYDYLKLKPRPAPQDTVQTHAPRREWVAWDGTYGYVPQLSDFTTGLSAMHRYVPRQ
jgi:S1-C subfamily serine protease